MKRLVNHIIRLSLAAAGAAVMFVSLGTLAKADNAKRGINHARSAVPSNAIKYSFPTFGSVDLIVAALGQQKLITPPATTPTTPTAPSEVAKVQAGARDTSESTSKFVRTRVTTSGFEAVVFLTKQENQLDIGIYNMLGKRLGDVYTGAASKGEHTYSSSLDNLPEGVYICIMQGSDFRRAAKFYLNR